MSMSRRRDKPPWWRRIWGYRFRDVSSAVRYTAVLSTLAGMVLGLWIAVGLMFLVGG